MRPQLPVLAILAVLAVPPSAAFADGEPAAAAAQATADPAPTTTVAPATPETPAAPVTPTTPPASTTTVPPPVPTPTAPGTMTTPERSPGAPQLADPDRGSSDRATRAERRDRARRAAARRAAARAARDRRERAADRDDDGADHDERRAEDARTARDVLDAPATGLSALSVARFRIPPFLLPIYQAAGVQYGIRWEVLAAINEIETDYGRNLNVSSAGARGWMQFMPATWDQYGVDANGDRRADPYNPVDAIFAAARYLKAAGGAGDLRRAVFAYNHADWYVDDVLRRARAIAGLPADVVQSLTGLTLAQPPVHVRAEDRPRAVAAARADDSAGPASTGTGAGRGGTGGGATGRRHRDGLRLRSTGTDRWGRIAAPAGSDVVAVQDATVVRIGNGPRLGRFIELRDAYGNRYKYANLDELATRHLVPRPSSDDHDEDEHATGADREGASDGDAGRAGTPGRGDRDASDGVRRLGTPDVGGSPPDPAPTAPATAGRHTTTRPTGSAGRTRAVSGSAEPTARTTPAPTPTTGPGRTPLVALGPARPRTAADDGGPTTGRGVAGPGDDAGLAAPGGPSTAPPIPTVPATDARPSTAPSIPTVPAPADRPSTTPSIPTVPGPADGPSIPAVPGPDDVSTAPSTAGLPPTGVGAAPVDAAGAAGPDALPGAAGTSAPGSPGAPTDGVPSGALGIPGASAIPGAPGASVDPGATSAGPFAVVAGSPFAPLPGVPTAPAGGADAASSTLLSTVGLLGRGLAAPAPPTWLRLARATPTTARPAAAPREDRDRPAGTRVDDVSRWMVRSGALRRADVRLRPLRRGSKVLAGSILGTTSRTALRLAIRPAGEDSPRIDPRPIVEGWRLLDDASVFGHDDRSELVADRGDRPDVGRILLMSKAQLQARVLADPKLSIYEAGRDDIRTGAIDRRVLATMEYLTANGLRLSISSLKSGHSYLSASGNVSAHSYGSAMDIAAVDGTPITGHQGPGSITASTIRLLLRLQGTVRPNQIISLMTFDGADNTLAMADHDDHIHVGFPRTAGDGAALGRQIRTVLQPSQWDRLVGRLARIDNPTVRRDVSRDATRPERGAGSDRGR